MEYRNRIPVFLAMFSVLSCTAFIPCLVAAQNSAPRLTQRAPFDNMYYVAKGEWVCSKKQLREIGNTVAETVKYARQAIDVLQVPGAEDSEAYQTWFGPSNANTHAKTRIIDHHYRIAFENLGQPSIPVTLNLGGIQQFQVAGHVPPVTAGSMVYACPEKKEMMVCKSATAAVVGPAPNAKSPLGTTMIYFCPEFFSSRRISETEMKKQWGQTSSGQMSRGMILLHELQHMATATTNSEHCSDYAYEPELCKSLGDGRKIRNAQNYALFALDVSVNPNKGKPGSK
ncbi:hypothetical protein CGRA01v4_14151 [Colletotrichum graminicola]|uniref:Lysine-specific metallo-endopeptidase domain-containing protein n=1 Tax=Colletotrichum graminicola (strain M1.001 / M2 / FGSC 10212) TaxID=645133 RepID=E3R086_COLGM|nr:uncharacterized protein GLRG_11683 [Colletotrichum graminicola M1.001]EFQ36524.1 hypothetical protein GLRG_11683 [Colletotrichum graminicola M1.001]WDK22860.1 hypothetical protein CGRA01v4_14151 [Colletotrichum graminicola]